MVLQCHCSRDQSLKVKRKKIYLLRTHYTFKQRQDLFIEQQSGELLTVEDLQIYTHKCRI